MELQTPYIPKNKVRIVTAASLFDGHDAAINIMRRIIQATGVEVIHLGHDRSVEEVVNTAIQEDANAIFNTSLIYELGVLKGIAKPILQEITHDEPEYAEAQRLLAMLKYIRTIPDKLVPTNSLLKEFVGGGDFKY